MLNDNFLNSFIYMISYNSFFNLYYVCCYKELILNKLLKREPSKNLY